MKNFIYIILAGLFFASQLVLAAPQDLTTKGQLQSTLEQTLRIQLPFNGVTKIGDKNMLFETDSGNILANKGFEHLVYNTGWTASGGTSAVGTTVDVGTGSKSYTFDASASGQTVTSTAVPIPNAYYGNIGEVSCYFKTAATDYIIEVYDGTNILASGTILSSTNFTNQSLPFQFPSSGNISLRVKSSSNASVIVFDDCYIGPSKNIANNSQGRLLGSKTFTPQTASCTWSTTAAGPASFTSNASCPSPTITGSGISGSAKDLKVDVVNGPPGIYEVTYVFPTYHSSTGDISLQLYDGTTQCGWQFVTTGANSTKSETLVCYFVYTTAVNKTFEVRGGTPSGTMVIRGDAGTPVMTVKYYPTANTQSINPSMVAQSWSGYHDSTCSWARTNAAYGDPTADASCALVQRTNTNFGTVSSVAGLLPGITFTSQIGAKYYICANTYAITATAGASEGVKLTDGTTDISESAYGALVVSSSQPFPNCGTYVATSTSSTVRLQTKASSGSITIGTGVGSAIEWSVINISQPLPQPLLVNSITTDSPSVEKMIRLQGTCSSSSSISSQSGSGVTIGNIASGCCALTIPSGVFSSAPTFVSGFNNAASSSTVVVAAASSATAGTVCASTGGTTSYGFNIIGLGPR